MSIPAAWHPDPTGRHEKRYWDGAAWTDHVFSRGEQGIDSLHPSAPDGGTGSGMLGEDQAIADDAAVAMVEKKPVAEAPKKLSRREARRQGRDEFESTALAAAHGDRSALAALPDIVENARAHYRGKKFDEKAWKVMTVAARDVLSDDLVTEEEEQHILQLADAIGIPYADILTRDFELYEELVIARINDGRLPTLADPPLITKRGEVAYLAQPVALMKEVAVREMRGGSRGVSVRIAKGVSYRVGQSRARSVVVGTQLQVQDTGDLVLTNERAVFVGNRRTLEFRYDRLIGMEEFADGLRLNVSNRQLASLFRFSRPASASIAAALIARSG
ncbi:DUF2510 domain-containing protein [Microbacterium sp. BK668]|uniref:DUF2510 domain-containing protein n=1 Tax=Microbacterium sp. BK668 TaxID=2512118 RepID=UPI001AACFA2E|nr:DUF2510 domain-containing protein [Microbacterium sp. BK668]